MDGRRLIRHTLATLAYRGGKALRAAPAGFADFQAGHGLRTPGEILAHLGDLLDWARSIASGQRKWQKSPALPWEAGTDRFFAALKKFDAYPFFSSLGDALETGPTGNNLRDLRILLAY